MKLTRSTLPGALLLGLTVALTPTHRANGQPASPVGTTWDAIVSGGSQRGIAYLFFADDRTLTGYQLLAPKPPSKDSSFDSRTPYGDVGRTFVTNAVGKTNLYGFGQIRGGSWGYDERGRIVGSYAVLVGQGTNPPAPFPFTFTGKVAQNSLGQNTRMTLVTYTPNGKLTYSAKPFVSKGLDLSGNWFATRKTGGQTLTDFFPVSPGEDEWLYTVDQDVYYTDETGYSLRGVVLWSSQKKVGFTLNSIPFDLSSTNEIPSTMFATFGTLSKSYGIPKASTTGVQEPYNKVVLNAVWQSPLAPPPEAAQ